MVKNPRKKTSLSRIHSLNRPEPVQVEQDHDGRPSAIILRGRRDVVVSIEDMWEIVDEWWRASHVARRYYRIAVQCGGRMTLFHDLTSGIWYKQWL